MSKSAKPQKQEKKYDKTIALLRRHTPALLLARHDDDAPTETDDNALGAAKRWLRARCDGHRVPVALQDAKTWDFFGANCACPSHAEDATCPDCTVLRAGIDVSEAIAHHRSLVPHVLTLLASGMRMSDAGRSAFESSGIDQAGAIRTHELGEQLIDAAFEQAPRINRGAFHDLLGNDANLPDSYFTWLLREKGLEIALIAAITGELRTPQAYVDLDLDEAQVKRLENNVRGRISYVEKKLQDSVQNLTA